jgi:hypothetical protein
VKYVVKDFPLESIHKLARKLAETSNCAAEQGKFWEMRDRFFADQKNLKLEDLPVHAQALGLQQEIFKQCLDGKVYASKISGDVKEAQGAAVRSVPHLSPGLCRAGRQGKGSKDVNRRPTLRHLQRGHREPSQCTEIVKAS